MPDKTIRYLYDGNDEIGFEEDGQLSIRILGNTAQAEIGSAIALQIKGATYIPLHDLQGNVSILLNPNTNEPTEEYIYSPFGQQNPSTQSQNPWRYLSKHTDNETGFVFFGRRYYDPSSGRFLTSDPKGYTDSLSLYAYALNDPFLLIDPYGLENEPSQMAQSFSDLGSITISSVGTFGSGAWNSFSHPIDALGGLSNDLTHLSSSAFNGNLSTLTAAWKAMDWDQRMRLISFQTSRVVGIGVTVSGLGGLYQLGCRAAVGAYFGGKVLFQSMGRLAFPKVTLAPVGESVSPFAVRFSQPTISQNFRNNATLHDLIQGLRSGKVGVNDIPTIRVVEYEGNLITLDNRRLAAFQSAKIESIPIQKVSLNDLKIAKEFDLKFNPINNGKIIDVISRSAERQAEENFLRLHGKIR